MTMNREKIRVGIESKWNSAELRGERQPSNGAIRKEEMTAKQQCDSKGGDDCRYK
jgi:hypothetical protein